MWYSLGVTRIKDTGLSRVKAKGDREASKGDSE